ncbi:MAG: redox-sensing transcriptional repressor Rex [Chlorobi bacterium]|nr:redox-sensing transcriptional repressor Rex [Chlorobiota bacterium]
MGKENKKKNRVVPEPALRRMPCYLAQLKVAKKEGQKYISSPKIANIMDIDPTQVTKDLSYTKIAGKTRVGYEVEPLIEELEDFLGFKSLDEAFLFGVGSLGTALIRDFGLKQFGLNISAGFDINPDVIGQKYDGVEIYHVDKFKELINPDIKIGILTVPVEVAQETAELMIDNGIKAIWNFTPVILRVPDNIVVQNTSLYAHLAVMFNRLHSKESKS